MSKTINVKLYHNNFGDVDKYIGEIPVKIKERESGKLKAPDDLITILEAVYARTQNIEDSWGKRYGLGDHRSTSVQDYMIIEGGKWYVADIGFSQDPVDFMGRPIKEVS